MIEPVKISVVIPALNEEAHIGACLVQLCLQTLPRELFEVLLVDNGSTDATVARAREFQDKLQLRILEVPRCTISELRNTGAATAAASVLAFLDADCMAEPDWLEQALAHKADNAIWGAHYRVQRDATWVGRVWFTHQATEQSGPVAFLPGGCLITTRSVLDSVGGFNPNVHTSEDVDLCTRAKRAGNEVLAYPELAVFHEGTPRTLRRFYRQNRWHGKHVMRVFLADLPSIRNLPLVLITFYTFVMSLATVIVPFFALPKHPVIALLPLVLLLVLPLLLAAGKAARSHSYADVPQLTVLYLTYLLARASALATIPSRGQR